MEDTRLTPAAGDVAAGASFFRDVLALQVRQRDASHVEVELGDVTATLMEGHPDAAGRAVEPPPADAVRATGSPAVILEVEVTDVREALIELRRRGATVLLEPVLTDWGTESAFVAGPDGLVVEIYRERYPRRH